MWKSLQEAVATKVNLFLRRSSSSTLCPICNRYEESLVHLFLQCSWVEEVWIGVRLTRGLRRDAVTSWANWLGSIGGSANGQTSVRNEMLSYVATTCWFIWKARCNFLFNQQPIVPRQIIAVITQSVAAFKEYTQATVCSLPISVNDLGSDTRGSWEAFPILARCKRMGEAFNDCRWSWTPRSANMAADRLALRQSREVCDNIWVDRPPSSLVHVLCNDGLPCPH
ncbi:unnamed protein product [Malus baccata var. baccata]